MENRKTKKAQKNTLALLSSLGGCNPDVVGKLLELSQGDSESTAVMAACIAICTVDPEGRNQTPLYQKALDILATPGLPGGPEVLEHIAADALNGNLKLEAVRRLGCVVRSDSARNLLRTLAKEGFNPPRHFSNERLQPDTFRLTALAAIGQVEMPSGEDFATVNEVLATELAACRDSAVFQGAVQCMQTIARAKDIDALIAPLENRRPSLAALRILGVLSKFDPKTLGNHSPSIPTLLSANVGELLDGEHILLPRLVDLAGKVGGPIFTKGISGRVLLPLDNGRGLVLAAGLEAHNPVDRDLTATYLAFARQGWNVSPKSRCILGLFRCAKSGHAPMIITGLLREFHEGYQIIVRSVALRAIFGSSSAVVDGFCRAMEKETDPSHIQGGGKRTAIAFIAASLEGSSQGVNLQVIEEHRGDRERFGGETDLTERVVQVLKDCPPEDNAVALFATQFVKSESSPGLIAIASWLFAHDDQLARYFGNVMLTAASEVDIPEPGKLPKESPLVDVEEIMFRTGQRWVSQMLPKVAVVESKVNRYVLDLMRRRNLPLATCAQEAMGAVSTTDDASFVLETLAEKGTWEAIDALGRYAHFVKKDSKFAAEVRATAIALVGHSLKYNEIKADPRHREALLSYVHGCFEDTVAVRSMAYRVCSNLAMPESIRALRGRLATDQNPEAVKRIKEALASIGDQLLNNRPSLADQRGTVNWLEHVAQLGDPRFADEVCNFLLAIHPECEVRVAALKCLESLGDPKSIGKIDQFIEEVSPSGEALRAAQHAKGTLRGRNDLGLLDALCDILPAGAPILGDDIPYDQIVGTNRIHTLAKNLRATAEEWRSRHWDALVTCIDGTCDVLNRVLYERYSALLGLDEAKSKMLAKREYGNRVEVSEFAVAFSDIQALMLQIHRLRQEASTPHPEDSDGKEKAGIEESDGELALLLFQRLFPPYVTRLWDWHKAQSPVADRVTSNGKGFV